MEDRGHGTCRCCDRLSRPNMGGGSIAVLRTDQIETPFQD